MSNSLETKSTNPANNSVNNPDNNTGTFFNDIDPSTKFNDDIEEFDYFDDMGLDDKLLRGIYSMGYEVPSVIQKKAIVKIISGRDLIAQSQSGTGKTATFLIGSMQRVDPTLNKPQILILSPTRELSQQIYENYKELNCHTKYKGIMMIGGTRIDETKYDLQNGGVHIIIGTPGRVVDMIKRNILDPLYLKTLVIDEADEMLKKGFQDQLIEIFKAIAETTQICLFSATMPISTIDLTKKFMRDPLHILVKRDELTLEGIKQYYLGVEDARWKLDTLYDLYDRLNINQTIIFVNEKKTAEWLSEKLKENGFTASCIHGDMEQIQRDKKMLEFRCGRSRVLVTTDIFARGIDIQQVSVVINYELPKFCDTYLHRIGRSGRFGRKGVAINFVTKSEYQHMKRIIEYYNTQIEPLPDNIKSIL